MPGVNPKHLQVWPRNRRAKTPWLRHPTGCPGHTAGGQASESQKNFPASSLVQTGPRWLASAPQGSGRAQSPPGVQEMLAWHQVLEAPSPAPAPALWKVLHAWVLRTCTRGHFAAYLWGLRQHENPSDEAAPGSTSGQPSERFLNKSGVSSWQSINYFFGY